MADRRTPVMSERRVGLIGAMLVAIGPISMSLYTPAMPELVRDFGTTEAVIKLTLSFYFAGFAFAQLIAGPLSDGLGRRPVAFAFIAVYVAASIAAALSPQVEVLLAARLVQGIGASVGVATSRAIVRDLFTGEQSSRIMNLIGALLALGPALAPTIGGLMLIFASWRATFVVMVAFGVALMAVIGFAMRESGHPDPKLIRPVGMLKAYGRLLGSAPFMAASIATGATVGMLYTVATVLPFVLIGVVGLSPLAFGVGMIGQSGSYFVGTLVAGRLMRRHGADALVPVGIAIVVAGGLALAASAFLIAPSYLSVMIPVACYTFGIAFVTPALTTAALHPYPASAGAASALMGFIQMGTGFAGGAVAALLGDPLTAMGTVVPALALLSAAAYLAHRRIAGRTPPGAEPRGKLLP